MSDGVGPAVRALRQGQERTLEDLAAEASVSRNYLIRIEQGQSQPTIPLLCRVVRPLGRRVILAPTSRPVADDEIALCEDDLLPAAEAV